MKEDDLRFNILVLSFVGVFFWPALVVSGAACFLCADQSVSKVMEIRAKNKRISTGYILLVFGYSVYGIWTLWIASRLT